MEKLYQPKPCATCGEMFTPATPRVKYCSDACRYGMATCTVCGKEFMKKSSTTGQYCSLECWYKKENKTGKEKIECPVCHEMFYPNHYGQIFCSKTCTSLDRRSPKSVSVCPVCQTEFTFRKGKNRTYCSRACANIGRNRSPVDIGSRVIDVGGYALVKVPRGTPGAYANNRMLEHRYVMQQKIGRPLEKGEHVHHINGDKRDNRPENLELWKGAHPQGVRVE